jgi:hypothetical protein
VTGYLGLQLGRDRYFVHAPNVARLDWRCLGPELPCGPTRFQLCCYGGGLGAGAFTCVHGRLAREASSACGPG